jgi:glycosyltransferase involved in cell wall biosynthesis
MVPISILMPVYNMDQYLEGAIKSALTQTYPEFELLIIDDQSTDHTAEIVKSFKDKRIKYFLNEKNLGPIKNFNKCLHLADTEFIVFLHADDQLKPNMLEKSYKLLKEKPNMAYTFSSCEIIDSQGNYRYLNKPFKQDLIWSGPELYKRHLYSNFVLFPSVFARRECVIKLGGFDEQFIYVSDWDLWLRIEACSYKVGYFSDPLAKYRVHPLSGTSFLAKKGLTEFEQFQLISKHLDSNLGKEIFSKSEQIKIKTIFKRRVIQSCFLRSRAALLQGKVREAWNKIAMLKKWKDSGIFEYHLADLYLFFSPY